MTMLDKDALEGVLSSAAQQFGHHDSDIARYLSAILFEIEVNTSIENPTSAQGSSVLPENLVLDEGALSKHISDCSHIYVGAHQALVKLHPQLPKEWLS